MSLISKNLQPWFCGGGLPSASSSLLEAFNDVLVWPLGASGRGADLWEHPWAPALDIHETDQQITVKADLPGMSRDKIQVTVRESLLTIKGERAVEAEGNAEAYCCRERARGRFERVIQLPKEIEGDKVKASYKEGVLKLILPKKPQAQAKNVVIDVQ